MTLCSDGIYRMDSLRKNLYFRRSMAETSAPTNGLGGRRLESQATTLVLSEYIMRYFPGERAANMSIAT